MAAALYDAGGGDHGQTRLLLQLGDGERAAVAHGAAHLGKRYIHAVLQCAGIRHVAVHALFKAQLARAAQVVPLPVARAVGALAPILFHICAVDAQLVRGAFIEAGEIAAQHHKVRAHGQRQRDVVIVHDAAVGADGHIHARLLKILVPGLGYFNDSRCLAAADALGLAGDADGTAADTDLHEIRARLCQKAEALAVHHIACAHLDAVAVFGADPADGAALPLGKALGGIDAQHVRARFHQRGHALCVIAGIDARTHDIALVFVQQLVYVLFVGIVILAEHHAFQVLVLVDEGQ